MSLRFGPAPRMALLAAAGALLSVPASGDTPVSDQIPSHTVAFFNAATCPPGWIVATVATGRLVVGVTNPEHVGVNVGMPLADQEDRAHVHPYAAEVSLPSKSIVAAGGGNRLAADPRRYAWNEVTQPGTSGYPFIQLVACEKP